MNSESSYSPNTDYASYLTLVHSDGDEEKDDSKSSLDQEQDNAQLVPNGECQTLYRMHITLISDSWHRTDIKSGWYQVRRTYYMGYSVWSWLSHHLRWWFSSNLYFFYATLMPSLITCKWMHCELHSMNISLWDDWTAWLVGETEHGTDGEEQQKRKDWSNELDKVCSLSI